MKIFITGVSCIGKTTIGKHLADKLGYQFYDLDEEIEKYFEKSIGRIKLEFLTEYSFRKHASIALKNFVGQAGNKNYILALPPSGLMDSYFRIIKRIDCVVIVLKDKPENILERITFYDIDSNPIEKQLTEREKNYYLKEIKEDIRYFGRTHTRANLKVDISNLGIEESVSKIAQLLPENYKL